MMYDVGFQSDFHENLRVYNIIETGMREIITEHS